MNKDWHGFSRIFSREGPIAYWKIRKIKQKIVIKKAEHYLRIPRRGETFVSF